MTVGQLTSSRFARLGAVCVLVGHGDSDLFHQQRQGKRGVGDDAQRGGPEGAVIDDPRRQAQVSEADLHDPRVRAHTRANDSILARALAQGPTDVLGVQQ
jgi:hypothetical protein